MALCDNYKNKSAFTNCMLTVIIYNYTNTTLPVLDNLQKLLAHAM